MSSTKKKQSQYQKGLYWHGKLSPHILSRHIIPYVVLVGRCYVVFHLQVTVFSRLYPMTGKDLSNVYF